MNLWKAVNARIYRCRAAFLHFLTKTHQNMANRIRERYSLRSLGIAEALSAAVAAPPTPRFCTPGPLLHYAALRLCSARSALRAPGSCLPVQTVSLLAQAHGTVYGMPMIMGTKGMLFPFSAFFQYPLYNKNTHLYIVHIFLYGTGIKHVHLFCDPVCNLFFL